MFTRLRNAEFLIKRVRFKKSGRIEFFEKGKKKIFFKQMARTGQVVSKIFNLSRGSNYSDFLKFSFRYNLDSD